MHPKRKRKGEDIDSRNYIKKKIKKLERKLLKGRRRSSTSSDSERLLPEPQGDTHDESVNVLDNLIESEPSTSGPSHEIPTNTFDLSVTPEAQPETDHPAERDDDQLDESVLEILGVDPSTTTTFGKEIQRDLAVRFEHIATSGLTKDQRKELVDSHLTPENCKLIDPPSLNPEIRAAITDLIIKRDKAIVNKQKQLCSAITSIGEAITLLLSKQEKDPTILKLLMDSARILCDSQHSDSITRRNFILAVLKKELKDQVQMTKIDNLLFGNDLAEALKTAKAIHKSGTELKSVAPPHKVLVGKPKPSTQPRRNLNWKAPVPYRRPMGQQGAKQAAPSTRPQRAHSSRASATQPDRNRSYR